MYNRNNAVRAIAQSEETFTHFFGLCCGTITRNPDRLDDSQICLNITSYTYPVYDYNNIYMGAIFADGGFIPVEYLKYALGCDLPLPLNARLQRYESWLKTQIHVHDEIAKEYNATNDSKYANKHSSKAAVYSVALYMFKQFMEKENVE